MNEKNNVTELSFSDIIKMFKGKGRILFFIIVTALVLSIVLTLINAKFNGYYGDKLEFRVSHTTGTDNLVPLLKSESFAERLLLDNNGLPPKEECDPDDYDTALSSINAYNECKQKTLEAVTEYEHFVYNVTLSDGTVTTWDKVSYDYTKLQEKCDEIISLLKMYKSANADAVAQDPNHLKKTAEYEAMLEKALANQKNYEDTVYTSVLNEKKRHEQRISIGMHELEVLRDEADRLTEKVIAVWRNNDEITQTVSLIQKSLSVTRSNYVENADNADNSSFIEITVSVKGNPKLAEYIIIKLQNIVPVYVEGFIESSVGSISSRCTLITPHSYVKNFSTIGLAKRCVKIAFFATVFALALYCFFVVSRNYVKRAMEE